MGYSGISSYKYRDCREVSALYSGPPSLIHEGGEEARAWPQEINTYIVHHIHPSPMHPSIHLSVHACLHACMHASHRIAPHHITSRTCARRYIRSFVCTYANCRTQTYRGGRFHPVTLVTVLYKQSCACANRPASFQTCMQVLCTHTHPASHNLHP